MRWYFVFMGNWRFQKLDFSRFQKLDFRISKISFLGTLMGKGKYMYVRIQIIQFCSASLHNFLWKHGRVSYAKYKQWQIISNRFLVLNIFLGYNILVLSIRVGRTKILIWDPRFLAYIWSAQNSKTFELCPSVFPFVRPFVRLSVRSNHDCVRTQRATNFKLCK